MMMRPLTTKFIYGSFSTPKSNGIGEIEPCLLNSKCIAVSVNKRSRRYVINIQNCPAKKNNEKLEPQIKKNGK